MLLFLRMVQKMTTFFEFVRSRSAEIIDPRSLEKKLSRSPKLRVKLGIDANKPDLHLGHVVTLRMVKAFQDAGHRVVLIIGDFTGMIGDPSGRTTVRTQLAEREVKKNERTYLAQFGRVLNLKKTEIRHNSEWYRSMKLIDFLGLLSEFSLKSAWEREDFQKRLQSGKPVQMNEAMYHVLQGYDSVMVRADIEIGAVDQRLNILAGRELQARLGETPQDIVLVPYLIGLDGRQKMSKSLGNTINLTDSADEMFGKVMSIPDVCIINYAELAAWMLPPEVQLMERRLKKENPRDVKLDLAEAITALYQGATKAERAREAFIQTFSKGNALAAAVSRKLAPGHYRALELVELLGVVHSKSEARRLLTGRAVEVDGRVIAPSDGSIPVERGSIIRIGKKTFFRVV